MTFDLFPEYFLTTIDPQLTKCDIGMWKLKLEISTLILGYINQYINYVMTSTNTS